MEIMNVVKKKKKKGFTLIELIAVIAILAILGVILVPKVAGYATKATKAKDLANAKQLVQAIEMYNTDHDTALIADTNVIGVAATKALITAYTSWPNVNPKTSTAIYVSAPITTWDLLTYANLKTYATQLEQ